MNIEQLLTGPNTLVRSVTRIAYPTIKYSNNNMQKTYQVPREVT